MDYFGTVDCCLAQDALSEQSARGAGKQDECAVAGQRAELGSGAEMEGALGAQKGKGGRCDR